MMKKNCLDEEESSQMDELLDTALRYQHQQIVSSSFRREVKENGLYCVPAGLVVLKELYSITNLRLAMHEKRPRALYSLESMDIVAGFVWHRYLPSQENVTLGQLLVTSTFGSEFLRSHDLKKVPYRETFQQMQEAGFICSTSDVFYLHKSIDQYLEE